MFSFEKSASKPHATVQLHGDIREFTQHDASAHDEPKESRN